MTNFNEDIFVFKLLLIGDATVGKSCLLEKYTNDNFIYNPNSTIGVDFKVKDVEYEGVRMSMQMWDTAGQERYKSITSSYYKGADCVFLCFDISNRSTFLGLESWLNNVKKLCKENVLIYLVGTKLDLIKDRQVEDDDIQKFIRSNNIPYYEVSSKKCNQKELHDMLFSYVIKDIYNRDNEIIKNGSYREKVVLNKTRNIINKFNKTNCC